MRAVLRPRETVGLYRLVFCRRFELRPAARRRESHLNHAQTSRFLVRQLRFGFRSSTKTQLTESPSQSRLICCQIHQKPHLFARVDDLRLEEIPAVHWEPNGFDQGHSPPEPTTPEWVPCGQYMLVWTPVRSFFRLKGTAARCRGVQACIPTELGPCSIPHHRLPADRARS